MTNRELSGFRRMLESKERELRSSYNNRESLSIETSADELDRIQNANEQDYTMNNLQRLSNQLREVRLALSRIGAGTFGICAACAVVLHLMGAF